MPMPMPTPSPSPAPTPEGTPAGSRPPLPEPVRRPASWCAVAVLVALADRGWVIGLWALGVVLAVQVLEGHVLQPVIQSRTVQMHPAAVMLAITAGASVAGILGMLLAVPLTAAAFGVLSELRARCAPAAAGPGEDPAPSEDGP